VRVGLSLCLVETLDQVWTKTPTFYATRSALSSARATESMRFMVGAVGIEIALPHHKDLHGKDLAPPPHFNCC
jgi:hypothetical protein